MLFADRAQPASSGGVRWRPYSCHGERDRLTGVDDMMPQHSVRRLIEGSTPTTDVLAAQNRDGPAPFQDAGLYFALAPLDRKLINSLGISGLW